MVVIVLIMGEISSNAPINGGDNHLDWALQSLTEKLKFNTLESRRDTISHLGVLETLPENPHPPHVAGVRERRAAVLVCLFEGHQGELRVILTKRSENLSTHPGEVALPGGKMEEGDEDDSATALREAKEEIGLDPSHVRIVAFLEPFISKHLLSVSPVIGLLRDKDNFEPVLNTAEVHAVFDAPLEMFLKEDKHRSEEMEWMGCKYITHLFDFETENGNFLIWGFTASILIRTASVVYQREPPFEEHLPDFQTLHRDGIAHI
ncbi:nudix hydrolase 15, mitochondrial-like isoform X1 [Tasmannia lanceolata]|uniref:nudix hydrolase 15, mitochondrial-like isoform X1 n=1 Tax=Tasmannia lanceolata TaxID=3420 RepID=UPI0040632BB1